MTTRIRARATCRCGRDLPVRRPRGGDADTYAFPRHNFPGTADPCSHGRLTVPDEVYRGGPLRILITGSRHHTGHGMSDRIFDVIRRSGRGDAHVTIVQGGADGADAAAVRIARRHGFIVETIAAPWRGPCLGPHRTDPLTGEPWCTPGHRRPQGDHDICPKAGPRRNQRMVDLGADICLAFPIGTSYGTRDCAARAAAAGIDVQVVEPAPVTT